MAVQPGLGLLSERRHRPDRAHRRGADAAACVLTRAGPAGRDWLSRATLCDWSGVRLERETGIEPATFSLGS